MKIAAVILAAGRGTRFARGFKLLADCEGAPLVRRVARIALEAELPEIVVVTGHEREAVEAALAGMALCEPGGSRSKLLRFVFNPYFASGMASSLKAGLAAVSDDADGALILLGDMPRVRPTTLTALVGAFREHPQAEAIVPLHGGRRGNPALLAKAMFPRIAQLEADEGARRLLQGAQIVERPVDDAGVLFDVDSRDDLARG